MDENTMQDTEATTDAAPQEVDNVAEAQDALNKVRAEQAASAEDTTQEVDPRITKLRKEAEKRRLELREQQKANEALRTEFDSFKQSLAKSLGVGEQEASPEDLIKQQEERATAAEQRYNALLQRTALTDAVVKAKADPDLTIPVVKGTAEFAALDPSNADYEAQVAELVAKTVEEYPKLRAQAVPPSSGNTSTPTNNSAAPAITVNDLDSMSAQEIYDARKAGKLDHLFK